MRSVKAQMISCMLVGSHKSHLFNLGILAMYPLTISAPNQVFPSLQAFTTLIKSLMQHLRYALLSSILILDADQEFDAASKIRIDESNAYLRVEGPRVSSDTNYSYGISYVDGSNNITSENILAVYTCGLSHCVTCEYNTRNSSCSQ